MARMKMTTRALLVSALVLTATALFADISADFSTETGRIRPELHSAGFGPQVTTTSSKIIDEIKSMGFHASRTHDWALLNSAQRVCDYFHIFPLMHLDAQNPSNYVFAQTDYVLKRTREELGHDIFFRLGTSIEHSGTKVHFNSLIPEDFDKVAETFAGTVRHYNKGWANGYEWGIKYWEIWNEPDGVNNMWCLPDGDGDRGAKDPKKRADFQTSKLDQAYYYGCRNTGIWGYKDNMKGKYKVYYGLKMFGDLVKNYPVLCASVGTNNVTTLAAKSADGSRKAFLVPDYCSRKKEITVSVKGVAPDAPCTVLVHDYKNDAKRVEAKLTDGMLVLPRDGVNSAAYLISF